MDETRIREIIREELAKRPVVQRATVNAPDAAAYLGVDQDTLMAEVHKGKVPHTKIRGRYVFRLEALDRWMTEQEQANSVNARSNAPLEKARFKVVPVRG